MLRKFIALLIAAAAVALCVKFLTRDGIVISSSRHNYGVVTTVMPFAAFLNLHQGMLTVLEINGKTYKNVRGQYPFYLSIKNTNWVVCVTQGLRFPYQVDLHLISPENAHEVTIEHTRSTFGHGIGTNDAKFKNSAEFIGSNQLLLLTTAPWYTNKITVDISTGRLVESDIDR